MDKVNCEQTLGLLKNTQFWINNVYVNDFVSY